jgi:hypothetical protein
MVLPLLVILAFVILYLAVVYWYITIPVIIIVVWYFFFYNPKDSDKKDYQSQRNQNNSYQNYSQSNYDSNGRYKKRAQNNSYQKSKNKSRKNQARTKRINDRLEKFRITPTEAQIIFGKTWRSKLGKPEWEFYYTVRYIEINVQFDSNNRYKKKFGYLYSKVLQIIQIVMDENADTREDEEKQWKKRYSKYWWYDDHTSENYSEINDEEITEAFDIFGLTRESTKYQIKTKYRELTLKFHPDKNKSKDSTTKMTEINKAYEIIMETIA